MTNKPIYLVIGTVAMFFSLSAVAEDTTSGQAIFDRTCSGCHKTPAAIQAPTAELEARLASGTIRQHRFQLTETEIAQVVKYLVAAR